MGSGIGLPPYDKDGKPLFEAQDPFKNHLREWPESTPSKYEPKEEPMVSKIMSCEAYLLLVIAALLLVIGGLLLFPVIYEDFLKFFIAPAEKIYKR